MKTNKWLGAALTASIIVSAVSCLSAQAAESAKRFPPIPADKLAPPQKAVVGENYNPNDEFTRAYIRNPGLSADLGTMLNRFRDKGNLSDHLAELAILMTGKQWGSQLVWSAHVEPALKAGASQAAIDSIGQGKKLPGMTLAEVALYDFLTELLYKHAVSDGTFNAAVDKLGEPAVLNLMGVSMFYTFVAMTINTLQFSVDADKANFADRPDASKIPFLQAR
jgi:4-carboxymuconolactone decarboxylase